MRLGSRTFLAVVCLLVISPAQSPCEAANPSGTLPARIEAAFGQRSGAAVPMRVSDGRIMQVHNPQLACRTLHPPGSIFKLVTAFAALVEGVISESDTLECGGQIRLGGVVLHCTVPNGHGRVNIESAISKSCNVFFYNLGARLGADRITAYARLMGLASAVPSYAGPQAIGQVPARCAHPSEVARLAIGQAPGLGITLLQAAEMVRRIAVPHATPLSGGERGKFLPGNTARIAFLGGGTKVGVRAAQEAVRRGMRLAVQCGTCKQAALRGVRVAGKTGSPEAPNSDNQRSAWFVGFAPYEKPEVVVVVFVKRGHGFDTAAPIARRIFEAWFGRK